MNNSVRPLGVMTGGGGEDKEADWYEDDEEEDTSEDESDEEETYSDEEDTSDEDEEEVDEEEEVTDDGDGTTDSEEDTVSEDEDGELTADSGVRTDLDDSSTDGPTTTESDGTSSDSSTSGSSSLENEDDEDEDNDDNQERSKPSGAWTDAEINQGYLVSEGPEPTPDVHSDESGFIEHVAPQVAWRSYQLSNGGSVDAPQTFMDRLHDWAEHYGHVEGKWLVFAAPDVADALWEEICDANERGLLGGYCEAHGLNRKWNSYYLATYCVDFSNVEDCERVLRVLHPICAEYGARVVTFKPDFLSTLGIASSFDASPDGEVEYTYRGLGVKNVWQYANLVAVREDVCGRFQRRRRMRRPRRRNTDQESDPESEPSGPYSNPYATNVQHFPTRPNGVWADHEVSYGWVVHGGNTGDELVVHRDRFLRKARSMLDEYVALDYPSPSQKRGLFRSLYRLAEAHRFVIGKWKVFPPAAVADEVWADICDGIDRGLLGSQAKISRYNENSGGYLICVYCSDFGDVEECERVLENLAGICAKYGVRVVANFKADFLTVLGIYTVGGVGRSINVEYALGALGLRKYWMNEGLKEILDELKARQREEGV